MQPRSSDRETQLEGSDEPVIENPAAGARSRRALPARIGNRYSVRGELGRGGMALVYRVFDEVAGCELALKLSLVPEGTAATRMQLLFEREFHVLSQLRHPRVIQVYDYGHDELGSYYTMELLDGGDLRERAPVPWRAACGLIFDVCSSLALLHSRRLVHCDVSPRNIRCTRDDQAKLIDFGAMAPMGPAREVVGTPAFLAPEMLHRLTLDARTDLFSLGATLYYTLTGRLAFRANHLSDVVAAWSYEPAPPSAYAAGIPPELDALVASLLCREAELRPRSAFEVMQRLAGIAGLQGTEPLSVSQAYLATPVMVGRDSQLAAFRSSARRALDGRGGGLLIEGAPGLGRSRALDACVLEAKTLGATVIRARASGARLTPLSAAEALAQQLLDTVSDVAIGAAEACGVSDLLLVPSSIEPESTEPTSSERRGRALKPIAGASELLPLQNALLRWIQAVSERRPLVIAVDDADRLDEPSVGLLAALANQAARQRLLVVATANTDAMSLALGVLASYCRRVELRPLELQETEALFTSIFDDVPNVRMLSARIHAVAGGRPRECMALAQHLLDAGTVEYKSGCWTLPEQFAPNELPVSVREMLRARIAHLSPEARSLAEAHAVSVCEALSQSDYCALYSGPSREQIDESLVTLVAQEVLVTDGFRYVLPNDELRSELVASLDDSTRRERHDALAALFERTDRPPLYAVHHLLAAGHHEAALDRLFPVLRATGDWTVLLATSQMLPSAVAQCIARALDAAEQLGRSARDINDLRCFLMLLSATADNALYWRAAPPLLEQLKRDSGFNCWQELGDVSDPLQRVLQALQRTGQAYAATPEAERVYTPDEAIKLLISYAVSSVPAGMHAYDARLLNSLPSLLEPFAPLTPLVAAMWQNTLASRENGCENRPESARLRWLQIYEGLAGVTAAELPGVSVLRAAMAYGVGLCEAQLGIETASKWVDILERDDIQRVTALYLRKTILLQRGDFEGAERARRQAELLAAQVPGRQPFVTLTLELAAHAAARDLRGVKQVADRISPLASRYAGWQPFLDLAHGTIHRLRGELDAARICFKRGLEAARPTPLDPDRSTHAWPALEAANIEALVELGHFSEAKAIGLEALVICKDAGIELVARDIQCAVALAEAKLGDHPAAAARLEALIAAQRNYHVAGLGIGVTYEARARVAIWAGDAEAIEHYTELTAHEYRHGLGSPLAARYKRLMNEVDAVQMRAPELSAFESQSRTDPSKHATQVVQTVVDTMRAAGNPAARAACALSLLCEAHAAAGGHLYLVDTNDLRYATSQSVAAPDAAFDTSVRDFWRTQHEDAATIFSDDATSDELMTRWSDGSGTNWRPVLMNCIADGEILCAAIAVLANGPRVTNDQTDAALTACIAAQLLDAGDAEGRRAV